MVEGEGSLVPGVPGEGCRQDLRAGDSHTSPSLRRVGAVALRGLVSAACVKHHHLPTMSGRASLWSRADG